MKKWNLKIQVQNSQNLKNKMSQPTIPPSIFINWLRINKKKNNQLKKNKMKKSKILSREN